MWGSFLLWTPWVFYSASSLQQTPAVSLTWTSKPPVYSGNLALITKTPRVNFSNIELVTINQLKKGHLNLKQQRPSIF